MPSTVTSIRLEIDLFLELQKRARLLKVTNNEIVVRALKAYLDVGATATEEAEESMKAILQERDAKIIGAVASAREVELAGRDEALADLQKYYNLYVSSGPKPTEAALSWVASRKERYPALRSVASADLLQELSGEP